MTVTDWATISQAIGAFLAIVTALGIYRADKTFQKNKLLDEAAAKELETKRLAKGLALMLRPGVLALEGTIGANLKTGEKTLIAIPEIISNAIENFHWLGATGDELYRLIGGLSADEEVSKPYIAIFSKDHEEARRYRAGSEERREKLLESCKQCAAMLGRIVESPVGMPLPEPAKGA